MNPYSPSYGTSEVDHLHVWIPGSCRYCSIWSFDVRQPCCSVKLLLFTDSSSYMEQPPHKRCCAGLLRIWRHQQDSLAILERGSHQHQRPSLQGCWPGLRVSMHICA